MDFSKYMTFNLERTLACEIFPEIILTDRTGDLEQSY